MPSSLVGQADPGRSVSASGGAGKLGRAGEWGRSDTPARHSGDANCARATSTAVKRDVMVFSIDVSGTFITSTFKSTNVSHMVSSISSRHCVTVFAIVVVWSLRVVRVKAIAVVLELTSKHTSTQRARVGSWVSSHLNKISILSIERWSSGTWLGGWILFRGRRRIMRWSGRARFHGQKLIKDINS